MEKKNFAVLPSPIVKIKRLGIIKTLASAVTIYSMIVPLVLLDIWTSVYQAIYFTINEIPKVDKAEFFTFDRWKLKGLNRLQRLNCVYCNYANALASWAKAVANQTELYSCAIKNRFPKRGQEHQENDYYKYQDFADEA